MSSHEGVYTRGISTGTPVPRTDRERHNRGSGPVITYQLSPEELERYRNMPKPNERKPRLYKLDKSKGDTNPVNKSNVSKDDYLRLRSQGLGRGRAGRELGLGAVELHWKLEEWGLEHRDEEQSAIVAWQAAHPETAPQEPGTVKPEPQPDIPAEAETDSKPNRPTGEDGRTSYLAHRANGLSRNAAFGALGIPSGSSAYLLKKWSLTDKLVEAAEIQKLLPKQEVSAAREPDASVEAHTQNAAVVESASETESSTLLATNSDVPDCDPNSAAAFVDKPSSREVTITVPLDERVLQGAFQAIVDDAYATAKANGWHNDKPVLPVQLALIHSEVSEALEADRKYFGVEAIAEELADVVIRAMDTAAWHGIDLTGALFRKMAENKNREYRHGGRKY